MNGDSLNFVERQFVGHPINAFVQADKLTSTV